MNDLQNPRMFPPSGQTGGSDAQAPAASSIAFTLAAPTKTLNEIRGLHYRNYAKHRAALAFEVLARTVGRRPTTPFQKAHIIIERHGERDVDYDGLVGGLKPLLDVMQPFHVHIRPDGIGIIASDAPAHLTVEIRQIRCKRGQGKTVVQIFEVSDV